MKRCITNRLLLDGFVAAFGLMLAGRGTGQTFLALHSFKAGTGSCPILTNSDGVGPGSLILSGNTLYGAAWGGGSAGSGTVFKLNTDGTGFETLYSFTASSLNPSSACYAFVNSDGVAPGSLILSGNTLYGAAWGGGSGGNGTVFKLNTDGTGFETLYSFAASSPDSSGDCYAFVNSDGVAPGSLIVSGNTLYGTAELGGSAGSGTVFKLYTDGTGFTNLYSFTDGIVAWPYGLILSGDTLYGTALFMKSTLVEWYSAGFSLRADGTDFTSRSFSPTPAGNLRLILSGTAVYGVFSGPLLKRHAGQPGSSGNVFIANADNTDFTNLYNFTATDISGCNGDGAGPNGLILSGDNLYGVTTEGGSSGFGTVFTVKTDGTGFAVLYSFTGGDGGEDPDGGLILSGNTLYGVTTKGGSSGYGTVFSLSFRPRLTITASDTSLILTWPANYAGFDYTGFTLQSSTNLNSSAVWTTNLPSPVVINGQNTVTNPISGTQKFFRLSK